MLALLHWKNLKAQHRVTLSWNLKYPCKEFYLRALANLGNKKMILLAQLVN